VSSLPPVSVVVVNWNGRHLLEHCLPSIAALDYPRESVEVIVFDNGSTDGSVDWLRQAWPAITVLGAGANLGFAAAADRAAAAAGGALVAFLNNDLRVEPGWLRRMVERLATGDAAVAGSRILDWEGARLDFDGAAMSFEGHGVSRGHGRPLGAATGAPGPALFACGAAMLAVRERFLAAGGFDPDYFAYFEDVDLGWRLWVQGERVIYVPDAVAYHRHHGSGLAATERRRLLERNALASVVKNYDDASLAIVLPAALALLEARARLAGDEGGAVYRDTLAELEERRSALWARRAAVQARRRRPDREILPLFVEPFRPSFFGSAYWREQRRIVGAGGVARLFGAAGAASAGVDDLVEDLQERIEGLERELGAARVAAAERERLAAEIARLEGELGARSRPAPGGLWRRVRG
jgi:GT2 family glycosyltransferase